MLTLKIAGSYDRGNIVAKWIVKISVGCSWNILLVFVNFIIIPMSLNSYFVLNV